MNDNEYPEYPELAAFVEKWRANRHLQGFSVDAVDGTVTLFVPSGEALPPLPHRLDDLIVRVVPLPWARSLRSA